MSTRRRPDVADFVHLRVVTINGNDYPRPKHDRNVTAFVQRAIRRALLEDAPLSVPLAGRTLHAQPLLPGSRSRGGSPWTISVRDEGGSVRSLAGLRDGPLTPRDVLARFALGLRGGAR
jgi:hypothetical protein